MSFTPPSVNYTYKTPLSSSELTQRNKNRMIYANYITKIQDNNVGCDTARTGLENGHVAPGSIIPDLIEGARYTTQDERDLILGTNACQFPVPAVVVPPFNPASYANLQLWLDAADVAGTGTNPSDGSIVTTWVDKSGAGGDATKFGNPTFASTGLNGNPALSFNGTSMGYRGAITNSGTVVTTFAVATLNSGTLQYGRLVSLAASGNDTGSVGVCVPLFRDNATPENIAGYRAGAKLSTQPTPAYDTAFYATSIFDGTNNTTYVNGVAGTSVTSSGTFGITRYGIGTIANGTPDQDYWKGYISEILIYNSALSRTDQEAIEGYLKEKWGIA
jgi:hypothetical protein